GVGTALIRREAGTRMTREPAHMHLVDDGLGPWAVKRGICFSVELIRVNYYALYRGVGVCARLAGGAPAVLRGDDNALSVRIEKHLVCVETKTSLRLIRTSHPIAVDLPRL